jgi:hypothetical protein
MSIEKRLPGCPPGVARNPMGKNQYVGDRGKMLGCRLPINLEAKFLERVEAEQITNTLALEQAVTVWLKSFEV